jgi:hypothetical protein
MLVSHLFVHILPLKVDLPNLIKRLDRMPLMYESDLFRNNHLLYCFRVDEERNNKTIESASNFF